MRFMLLLKGDTVGDANPSAELIEAMTAFNNELAKAGVLLAAEGLQSSARGARVIYSREHGRRVVDGPFAEAKEVVAGYYLIEVGSREEAIEWASRCPVEFAPIPEGEQAVIEVRQVSGIDELPEATDEHKAADRRLREEIASRSAS